MNKESILREKSFLLGCKVIELTRFLSEARKENEIRKQLLRSGTAAGALIREAQFAQSKADFISKMSIALKEANETEYWLSLLKQSGSIHQFTFDEINDLLLEVIKMLAASVKTAKDGNKKR